MAQIEVRTNEGYVWLTRMHQDLVISFEEAPELVRKLQAAIRAHTIQQQATKDDRSL